jgi:hypothetical protein
MRHLVRSSWLVSILAALVLGGVLGISDIATAQVSGPTITAEDGLCMQRIFLGSDSATVASSNALNCTAEDIKISLVESGTCVVADGGCFSTSSCINNQNFTLDAKFQMQVTSANRYDATFFFRTDGTSETQNIKGQAVEVGAYGSGANASGECSMSWLTPPPPANGSVLQLDGDACGDLNQGLLTGTTALRFLIPNVTCTSTADDGFVHLPFCTSWHNNPDSVCNTVSGATDPNTDPNKFTHSPDTKSKCTCGDLVLPITIRDLAGTVAKVATQALVTYQVTVTNDSGFDAKLSALTDSVYGNIANAANASIESTTCAVPQTVLDGGNYQCSFVVKHVNHDPHAADDVPNTVTAKLEDPLDSTNFTQPQGSTRVKIELNAAP